MVCYRSSVRKAAAPRSTKWGCHRARRNGDVAISEQCVPPRARKDARSGGAGRTLPVSYALAQRFAQISRHRQTTDSKQLA